MPKKVLIIFAQLAEAQSFLKNTKAQAVAGETAHVWSEGELLCRYAFDHGWVVIGGVGLHHAQMAVARYGHLCDEVWNLGLAGSLKRDLVIGDFLSIDTVGKYIPVEEESFTTPNFSLADNGSKLVSSDFPIHNTLYREQLGKKWDLVDMEGYGIAFAAAALGLKCRMWKIVSDFASPGGRELIRKHKGELSERMAQKIIENLH